MPFEVVHALSHVQFKMVVYAYGGGGGAKKAVSNI